MKTMAIGWMLILGGSIAQAQEPDDDELTPEGAMELLKSAHELMEKAEELLNDSSRGKALETEKDLLAKLEKLEPALAQKHILEKVGKMIEKAHKREKDAIDKINELIKKARMMEGQGSQSAKQQPKEQQGQKQDPKKPSGGPADRPYDPKQEDEVSRFRSTADRTGQWGNLPPAARAAILDAAQNEIPPEFQEEWSEYSKRLAGEPR